MRQGEEEQQLIRKQADLKEGIAGLKDRIDMAQTEEEQRFANLNEKVSAVDIRCEREVGLAREELQLKHQELGQAHEELKTEVAELRKRLSVKESTLRSCDCPRVYLCSKFYLCRFWIHPWRPS